MLSPTSNVFMSCQLPSLTVLLAYPTLVVAYSSTHSCVVFLSDLLPLLARDGDATRVLKIYLCYGTLEKWPFAFSSTHRRSWRHLV
ncbi:hypothetical protein CY34DRAFT_122026 [Suillus luteus UH-Slu-Lm8-n1]|uniref:Uncharacterized protein n=1 Tax=Suillus luteus UH-Slu-Lm8-n1 TaxID=930992 RepID=A0A0D0C4A2_9AGAM|nr:hypothetical protein CY34DRAFT_122026 [Suillus luteus UH-Slu-Lm8-n1]